MKGVCSVKKDRDCGGMAYPVYPQMVPNYGGMVMPGQMIPMPGGMNMGMTNVPLTSVQSTINSNDLNILLLSLRLLYFPHLLNIQVFYL